MRDGKFQTLGAWAMLYLASFIYQLFLSAIKATGKILAS